MFSFKIKKQKIAVLCLLIGVIISSCKSPKSPLAEYGPIFEKVMVSDTSVFRGFNFGDSLNFVQLKETNKPIEVDEGYLYYEYKLDSEGSFNIAYNFDELGLNEIHSDIFINDSDNADEVFNKFKTYFDEHFGTSQAQMGFTIWSVKSEKYGEIIINLSNESTDFTSDKAPGKISLWIYPDKS
ncbi:MAG: hypothetical protein K8R85_16275 [Bacteroidetes bacterium]|nr:hypothetical protein [Bacteroidota bacterium]